MRRESRRVRLVRLALRAFPAAFRRRYGEEIVETYLERHRRGEARRRRLAVFAELASLRDLVVSGLAERVRLLRRPDRRTPVPCLPPARPTERGLLMSLRSDIRTAMRVLWRRPAFTVVAVGILGIGIAASSAMFSIVNTVVLSPPPYPEPDRLVRVYDTNLDRGWTRSTSSPATFEDWREQQRAFRALASWTTTQATYTGVSPAEPVPAANVSAGMFALLGVAPELGRGFTRDDEIFGRHRVVVLSHAFWQDHFGGDPAIVGGSMSLEGATWTVVGVMPAGFAFPLPETRLWMPLAYDFDVATSRGAHYINVVGRLRPGVSLDAAGADLRAITDGLRTMYPEELKGWGVRLMTLQESAVGDVRMRVFVFFGAVGLVLLVACTNVANLALARAVARERELAVRAALGASRWRLVRHLVTEGVIVAGTGGILGLGGAYGILHALRTLAPGSLPRFDQLSLDPRAVGFCVVLSLAIGVGLGLASALLPQRGGLATALRDGDRSASDGLRHHRLRGAFVVTQIALALVLSVGAGLLVRSYLNLSDVSPGYSASNALTGVVSVPASRYPDAQRRAQFFVDLMNRLRTVPGVDAAAAATQLPLDGYSITFGYWIDGQDANVGSLASGDFRVVTPGYFETMGIPLVRGRLFQASDDATAPQVIIIDEAMARREFGDADPIGRRMYISIEDHPAARTIVGVVADVRQRLLDVPPHPGYYLPIQQAPWSTLVVVVRTPLDPSSLAAPLRRAVASMDPLIPVRSVRTLAERFGRAVGGQRFNTLLLASFAVAALVLAIAGIYSVMSYVVVQRRHELGVRMALGARSADIGRLVARTGLRWSAWGIAIGIGATLTLTRLLANLLFGVAPTDAGTIAGVSAGFLVVALLGALLPARRAAVIDPIEALRDE